MNGFGFIEYKDPMDARDVVPGEHSHPIATVVDYTQLTIFVANSLSYVVAPIFFSLSSLAN